MPKQKKDYLIQLVLSMTRAEKRHFRLFAKRNQSSEDILFLQLFDFIDKRKAFDEEAILQKIPSIKKQQLSNLKAHLYKQLLTSLRLLNKATTLDIDIRESLDYARVLYNKGLYRQSLDMLDKAKARALRINANSLVLEILEFEKHIESQYITNSIENRAEGLAKECTHLAQVTVRTHALSNLALNLYGLYLRVGYVRNKKDYHFVKEYFFANLPRYQYQDLGFYEKLYFSQSHVWYYHMTQDFPQCYRYCQRWVDIFREEPDMIAAQTPLYLKGCHNLLSTLFHLAHYEKFVEELALLERFPVEYPMNEVRNIEGLYQLYRYVHTIDKHYLEGTFTEGLQLIPQLMEVIESDEYNWDTHRILVFYYRVACLYFGSGDFDQAIHYLNLIINPKQPDFRADIQAFARILNLIAHFELGNSQLLEYQVKSLFRYLAKMEDLQQVQKEIIRFLRRIPRMREAELANEFKDLKVKLEKIREDPLERRPFLYLDIISWLDAKLADRPVQDIIRRKFLEKNPLRVSK